MKKNIILSVLILPVFLLANAHEGPKDYDLFHRAFNFLIFFGILFYLLKDIVKNAYNSRIKTISSRLESIQDSLKESKDRKVNSIKRLEEAKTEAISIIERAKKEIEIAKVKIEEQTQDEIKNLTNSYKNKKEFEKKKAIRLVVNDIIEETFDDNSINLAQKDLIEIINKKAS